MYLKQIKTVGFKSFADSISIDLSIGTTGIVGPNGSGKSNVVDAIRWVLGEQSIKSLRGESKSDIIFSGSKEKKPANYASVTLIFDNSDNFLPLNYTEISIKRILYNNNENEYYINNNRVRLKDVTDLLIDSGVNKESFNIISQGEVGNIISSKKEDRRMIFDSASGVLKYRKRKEETIRKLEKTHSNLERITDIINELKQQVEPLKKASEKAIKYKEVKSNLEKLDIALISNDITSINNDINNNKSLLNNKENEIINIETNNNIDNSKLEEYKSKINSIDEEIYNKNKELISLSEEVERLNGEKNLIIEKKKNNKDNQEFIDINNLKIKIYELDNNINNNNNLISSSKEKLSSLESNINNINNDIVKLRNNKQNINRNIEIYNKKIIEYKNSIEILEDNINNMSNTNIGVKSIINNNKLSGIHNTIGSIITVENEYMGAINTALAASIDFVITDNKISAEHAISYLKNNNLGRATFFPLDTINKREMDNSVLSKLKNTKGFIDIAVNLVSYDKLYNNIISNLLGNVIVADNINNANYISDALNKKYKVVTLDKDIVHIGGSITGGNIKARNSVLTDKYKLNELNSNLNKKNIDIKSLEKNEISLLDSIKLSENKYYNLLQEKINLEQIIENKNINNKNLINEKNELEVELSSFNDNMDDEYLDKYYDKVKEKDSLKLVIEKLNKDKLDINKLIEDKELINKKNINIYNSINKEINNLKLSISKNEFKLDNLLNTLNEEYKITYEKAINEYFLDLEISLARSKVLEYKSTIKSLGMINTEAVFEYEKVNTRYQFLKSQKQDLFEAENNLIQIINELDDVMKTKFLESFEKIKVEFSSVFKELFGGGEATLVLDDKNNLLETGIDIVARPKGKTLSSISLLSGGEKTLTAISLLFAIIKTKQVPFCVLDEVEAALDEVNVDKFGIYLNKLKDKTQFIVITHKKKTM